MKAWVFKHKAATIGILAAIILAETITLLALTVFSADKILTVEQYLELGNKYLLEENYEQALVEFMNAIEIEPNNIPAHIGMGRAYKGMRQYDDAESILFDIFYIERRNEDAFDELLSLALTLIENERYSDAESIYNNLIPEFGQAERIYIALQELYDAMQDYDKLRGFLADMRELGLEGFIVYGEVIGRVVDGSLDYYDDTALAGAEISMRTAGAQRRTRNTGDDGTYVMFLKYGRYEQTAEANGYIPFKQNIEIAANETLYLATIELVPVSDGNGMISGQVIDALTGYGVPAVDIEVYDQDENLIDIIRTDDYGHYGYSNAAGYYFLQVNHIGYNQSERYAAVIGYRDVFNRDLPLSPVLQDGEVRIVLTWGQYPSDLDSHLFGPDERSGGTFHIYYANKEYAVGEDSYILRAFLDLDDTSSYGPETTTIYHIMYGETYSFVVHDFSNRGDSVSTALANSGANVKVFVGSNPVVEFNVPPGIIGDRWHVFDMVNGVVLPPASTAWEAYFTY